MKKIFLTFLAIAITVSLAGCDSIVSSTGVDTTGGTTSIESTTNTSYANAKLITISNSKTETITAGGTYSISGTATDAKIVVDTTDSIKLELAGINIKNSSGAVIEVTNAKEVTLTLKDGTENVVADGGTTDINAAIFSNDTLIIEGNGKLSITGNQEHGVESDDDIIINGGEIEITAINDGLHANDNITINSGSINVLGAVEGIESKGDIIVNGGIIKALASDDGLNGATDITINGGELYIHSTKGDAIDSNGTITINDGIVVAAGGAQPEGGIDCDGNAFTIKGGTVIATGGSNSSPSDTSSTQNSVLLAGTDADVLYHIEGESGSILTYMSDHQYSSMLFSSPLLEKDKTYTIYTGGTATGEDTNGLYIDSEYKEGTKGSDFTISGTVTRVGGNAGMGGGMGGGMRPEGGKGQRPNMDGITPPDMEGMTPPDMEGMTPPDMTNPTTSSGSQTA